MHVHYVIFSLSAILSLTFANHSNKKQTSDITKLHVLNVQISQDNLVPNENCLGILQKLEKTINTASSVVHNALDGCLFIQTVNVFLPTTWHDTCLPSASSTQSSNAAAAYSSSSMDVTITSDHSIFKNSMWTKQYGGCGIKGSQIYVPYNSLGLETSGKEFAKEWSKYQFGIFDEHGFINDPIFPLCYYDDQQTNHVTSCSDHKEIENNQNCISSNVMFPISSQARTSLMYAPGGPNVSMFCDSGNHDRYAPTKQNYLCERKPTLDIILNNPTITKLTQLHKETTNSVNITNTETNFIYHRTTILRYVVIIDDSIDIARRDSYNFLRIALRKWVLYDLKGDVEVGILLASGDMVIRTLNLTLLKGSKERELVAAFLPYTTNTIHSSHKTAKSTCLTCALKIANQILTRTRTHNSRNTVLIIAPGLDANVDTKEKTNEISADAKHNFVVSINYPDTNNRQPLDKLSLALEGLAFTVQELRYNSERSHIQTYFQLSTLMMQLAHNNDNSAGLLEEIYRNVIYEANDSTGGSGTNQNLGLRLTKGHFYYDADTYESAEFLVYTHSTDLPLISGLKLVSPTGRTYSSLSDQRMGVKQLTLLASINKTGLWEYTIEHYNSGITQPHIVQVVALTKSNTKPRIQTHLQLQRSGPKEVTVACDVFFGKYPILNANVSVLITRHDLIKPNIFHREFKGLLDTGLGAGLIDLTQNDGIYTRQIAITQPGIYRFEVKVNGQEGNTFTVREAVNRVSDNHHDFYEKCCGRFYSYHITQELSRFKNQSTTNLKEFKYIQTIKTFERYTSPKTLYINDEQDDFKSHPQLQHHNRKNILDFMVHYKHQDEDIIEFSWSLSDNKETSEEIKYVIRYSLSIKAIIDHFDSRDKFRELSLSSLKSHTNSTNLLKYTLNVDQLPTHMRGKLLTFAIKQIEENSTMAFHPISNIQQILIKPLPPKTTTAKVPYLFTTLLKDSINKEDDGLHKDSNVTYYSINDLNAKNSSDSSFKNRILYYIIPALIALVLLVIISYLLWSIIKCGRNSKSANNSKHNSTVSTITNKCNQNLTNINLNYSEAGSDLNAGLIKSNSESMESHTLYTADHHTLGIPIYTQQHHQQQQHEDDDISSCMKNTTKSMYNDDSNEAHSNYRIVNQSTPPPLPTIYSLHPGLVATSYLNTSNAPYHENNHDVIHESKSQENCYIPIDYDTHIFSSNTSNVLAYQHMNTCSSATPNKYDLGRPLSNTPPSLPSAPTIRQNMKIQNYSYNHDPPTPTKENEEEICHHHQQQQHYQHQPSFNNSSILVEEIDTSGIAKRSRNVTMV